MKTNQKKHAIILAGGKGSRLRPYTTLIPKPLMPIGGEFSILEIILIQLKKHGFESVTITINHFANLIRAYFGNGERLGLDISYSLEQKPLSTIGPLTILKDLPNDFLVMNGDILTDLNFDQFFNSHVKSKNKISVSSYAREVKIDFGVLGFERDLKLKSFEEKPKINYDVSMGIYCINKSIIKKLPVNQPYGFDELMLNHIEGEIRVDILPFKGFWLDIGRPEDYDYANKNYQSIKKIIGI